VWLENEKKKRLVQAKKGKERKPVAPLGSNASCIFGQYVVVNWCEIVFHVDFLEV